MTKMLTECFQISGYSAAYSWQPYSPILHSYTVRKLLTPCKNIPTNLWFNGQAEFSLKSELKYHDIVHVII
jgi:hypothetical protein